MGVYSMSNGLLKIFSEVANQYELVNHLSTFYLDIPWRMRASQIAAVDGGTLWLEVCSGTGEMAVNLQKYASPRTRIILSDFSFPMVSKAKNIFNFQGRYILVWIDPPEL